MPDDAPLAGKDSQKLSMYYEPLGAWYMGRIENTTDVKDQRPYGMDDNHHNYSPKSDRLRTDDIEGASPNAFGNARFIKERNNMNIMDIPGAKNKFREHDEKWQKIGSRREQILMQVREGAKGVTSKLNVQDINLDGVKQRQRSLHRTSEDPLEPDDQLAHDFRQNGSKKHFHNRRHTSVMHSKNDGLDDYAQKPPRSNAYSPEQENYPLRNGEKPVVSYTNRNRLNNGDIVGLTNQSPMVLNQSFKPPSKRMIRKEIGEEQLQVQNLPISSPSKKLNMVEKTRHNDIMQAMQEQANRAAAEMTPPINKVRMETFENHPKTLLLNDKAIQEISQMSINPSSLQQYGSHQQPPVTRTNHVPYNEPYAGTLSARVNMQPLSVPQPILKNSSRHMNHPIDSYSYVPSNGIAQIHQMVSPQRNMVKRSDSTDFERQTMSPRATIERSSTQLGAAKPMAGAPLSPWEGGSGGINLRFQTNNILQSPTNAQMSAMKQYQANQQYAPPQSQMPLSPRHNHQLQPADYN